MAIQSINSNHLAVGVAAKFSRTSADLAQSFERLSTGLRINKPGDDPSGLSVLAGLNSKARIYTQAVRNVNDGISLFNVAEGTLSELSTILTRLGELANQAANGAYSLTQRRATDREAYALTEEFNRIVGSSNFNGRSLLNGNFQDILLQSGFGSTGSIKLNLGQELDRTTGDGTFQSNTTYTSVTQTEGLTIADVNGDGIPDLLAVAMFASDKTLVYLGNGDGTFQGSLSFVAGNDPASIVAADVNRDNILDLITVSITDDKVNVLLGNGNGTFKANVSYAAGTTSVSPGLSIGDVNGDGIPDIVSAEDGADRFRVMLGVGDGTFQSAVQYTTPTNDPVSVQLGDLNGDGKLDAVMTAYLFGPLYVSLGNGDGSFLAVTSYTYSFGGTTDSTLVDLNHDGVLDIAVATGNSPQGFGVFIGNGDGSFKAIVSYNTNLGFDGIQSADFNGDGIIDLAGISGTSDKIGILLGNGDGTFLAPKSYSTPASTSVRQGIAIADLNRDGAPDIVTAGDASNQLGVHIGNTVQLTTMPRLNLTTQASARDSIAIINVALHRVGSELGVVGANQRRLESVTNTLSKTIAEYQVASGKIGDVDVAEESSRLARNQVVQNAQAALLAQANLRPALVLSLLQEL